MTDSVAVNDNEGSAVDSTSNGKASGKPFVAAPVVWLALVSSFEELEETLLELSAMAVVPDDDDKEVDEPSPRSFVALVEAEDSEVADEDTVESIVDEGSDVDPLVIPEAPPVLDIPVDEPDWATSVGSVSALELMAVVEPDDEVVKPDKTAEMALAAGFALGLVVKSLNEVDEEVDSSDEDDDTDWALLELELSVTSAKSVSLVGAGALSVVELDRYVALARLDSDILDEAVSPGSTVVDDELASCDVVASSPEEVDAKDCVSDVVDSQDVVDSATDDSTDEYDTDAVSLALDHSEDHSCDSLLDIAAAVSADVLEL